MHELVHSGKSLAEIQTAWHTYYIELPDEEKHQVWNEFYDSNKLISKYHKISDKILPEISAGDAPGKVEEPTSDIVVQDHTPTMLAVHPAPATKSRRSAQAIKRTITDKVTAGGKLKPKHHFQSLAFGLTIGAAFVIITLFGFFNEVIIAPFIQPSRNASAAPLSINNNGVAPTSTPEVIIPKINVEIPVDYSQTTTDEATIENALESGIVHYPTTSKPGENGNAAFFGHSSNNIFNNGKYKFAFVLLHTLVPGDTFYLTYNGKVYVYKVISKTVVEPTQVEVLNPVEGQTATATLITCDPPGTSLRRLVVVGQQISPAVSGNTVSTASGVATSGQNDTSSDLPGNGPTLFSRIWNSIF
jgi:sortase A